MNLERSIRFTGDWHARTTSDGHACAGRGCAGIGVDEATPEEFGGQGIETKAVGAAARMTMKYHSMERCGRLLIGAYCHHLHHVGAGGGTFEGIAVTNSVNKAFVVHGTSHALVKENVVFQHRGAFAYFENGAEFGNTLMANVFGCRFKNGCKLRNGVPTNIDSDFNEQAAIYLLQPNAADVIGNHVYGQENAHFINQQAIAPFGQDVARGFVPTKAMPIANNSYNVFVDNAGFGWYLNMHTPLDVRIDGLGRVVDWRDAVPWHPVTGADNASPSRLEHHTEMNNVFSAGSYDAMDVTLFNYTIIGGDMGCYWKTYRRGLHSGPLLDTGSSTQRLVLPGGSGLVEVKDFTAPQLSVNHHCALGGVPTGGFCASHYWYNHPTAAYTPVLLDESNAAVSNIIVEVNTANEAKTYITDRADACFDTSACSVSGKRGRWLECPQSHDIRVVRIYSPDRGDLQVSTDDGTYTVSLWPVYNKPGIGAYRTYAPHGKAWAHGYNFLVRGGHGVTVTIGGSVADELFVLEYSENTWPVAK